MAARDLSGVLESRIREIVQPMLDEAVDRMMQMLMGGGQVKASRRGKKAGNPRSDGAVCVVVGCGKPLRSKGYCAAHYQSARKYGWPMPGKSGFVAPVRPRGRPPGARGKRARKAAKTEKAA